jgi:hypothetical protein
MPTIRLFSLLFGAALMATPQLSRAELLLYYNFENLPTGSLANNTAIDNLVAGRADGLFRLGAIGGTGSIFEGGTVSGGNLGRVLQLTPAGTGNANLDAPNIDTNFTAAALSLTPSTPYTAMAWVNFAAIAGDSGDNMIFGQAQTTGQGVLHLGARNTNYHSGHWGDDINTNGGAQQDVWRHVAFTNTAAGFQEIFVDGVSVASGNGNVNPTAGGMDLALNVLIGTSGNGGSFTGRLDEIKIYNEALTAAQIQQASVIPEPATAGLLALGAGALGLMARRRRA